MNPVRVELPSRTIQISASNTSAALLDTGACYFWGMGFGTPTRIDDRYFKSVQVGGQFSLLIDVEGHLMLWGSENDAPPQLSALQGLADKPVA
jgi:hypothetical protein